MAALALLSCRARGGSRLLGLGEEDVGSECASSLREAMRGPWYGDGGAYALADLFALPLASAPFGNS